MIEYPKLNYINNVVPYPHILLGKEIYWTIKEDGSNIGCYIKEGELLFRSRNMEVASPQFTQYMKATEQHDGIW
jgi:hypothetical protein